MNRHVQITAESTATSKGQTTVPKDVRAALGLRDGDRMVWAVKDGVATVRVRNKRAVDLAGFLGKPPRGGGLKVEEMDDVIAAAVIERFERSQR